MSQDIQISLPEHGFETVFIIDFEDKENVIQVLDLGLQWIKDYLANKKLKKWALNPKVEPYVLKSDPSDEDFPYIELGIDIFEDILNLYPDLEPKVVKWVEYILEDIGYGILTYDNKYLGHEAVAALAIRDKKYIKYVIDFLQINDMDHEDETQVFLLHKPIQAFGICDEVLELVAARFCSLCGQHGQEMSFPFEKLTEAQQNTYLKYLLIDINHFKRYTVEDRIETWLNHAISIAFDLEIDEDNEDEFVNKIFNERLHTIVKATADYAPRKFQLGDTAEERLAKIERNMAKLPTLKQLQDPDFVMPEFDIPGERT